MDLENLDCPQYLCFTSELFEGDSTCDASLSSKSQLSNQLSMSSNKEKFIVHTTTTKNFSSNLKKRATIPKPFKFETDNRLKGGISAVISNNRRSNFTAQLRQHRVSHFTPVVTKVKPFNLTKMEKSKKDNKYLTLAEQVKAFHKKTPDRFHTTSKKDFKSYKQLSPSKLRPKTPHCQTVKRDQIQESLNVKDEDAEDLNKRLSLEFDVQSVDSKICNTAGVEKAKNCIKAKSIDTKKTNVLIQKENSSENYIFHARPAPKSILSRPSILVKKSAIMNTIAKSPNFVTGKRLEKRKLLEQMHNTKENPLKKVKLEQNNQPTSIKPMKSKHTVIQPFSFDKADKERYALKEKKIQREKENRPFAFKTQPKSIPQKSVPSQAQKKPLSQIQPVNSVTNRNLNPNLTALEKSVPFKAQPAIVLQKKPFIPEKLQKQKIEFQEFNLTTNRRASKRLKLQREQQLLLEKKAKKESEELKTLKIRQDSVLKFKCLPQFKPVLIKRSIKPVTVPISPKFETDKRLFSKYRESKYFGLI